MDLKGFATLGDFIGRCAPAVVDWSRLDLHHKTVARIDPGACIQCGLCYAACNDAAHQCIAFPNGKGAPSRTPCVVEQDCVGCNLCSLVCPIEGCISMVEVPTGHKPLTWERYVKNGLKGYQEVYRR